MSEAEKQDSSTGSAPDADKPGNTKPQGAHADDVQDEALGEVEIPDAVMEAAAEAEKAGNKGDSR